MKIQIKNIGMIKEAEVKLDGLTIIAGENDTGKSTLGKLLFATIKADNINRQQKFKKSKKTMATWLNLVFDGNISNNGKVNLYDSEGKEILNLEIKDKNFIKEYKSYSNTNDTGTFFDTTLIQSPIIFDLLDFFDGVLRLREMRRMEVSGHPRLDFDFSYPVILWDLYIKISTKNSYIKSREVEKIAEKIQNILGGEFKKYSKFEFNKYFKSKVIKTEMLNTASGIKSFGLLQLLNNNGYLNKKYLLILDEPEVHLHPEWQIKYAEIIVNLVKNGIYIIANTHSPYMIQAIKHFSKEYKIEDLTNFYLTEKEEDGIQSKIYDKTNNLNPIFAKLTEPIKKIVWN